MLTLVKKRKLKASLRPYSRSYGLPTTMQALLLSVISLVDQFLTVYPQPNLSKLVEREWLQAPEEHMFPNPYQVYNNHNSSQYLLYYDQSMLQPQSVKDSSRIPRVSTHEQPVNLFLVNTQVEISNRTTPSAYRQCLVISASPSVLKPSQIDRDKDRKFGKARASTLKHSSDIVMRFKRSSSSHG